MLQVTFVVQNKNYGCFLPQCLGSILQQKGLDQVEYEIIGLDAGSVDDSREIYSRSIGRFVDVDGLTQAEALNLALKLAKGQYIAWINSDDYYLPNYLQTHLMAFHQFNEHNVSLVYSRCWQYNENAILLKWRWRTGLLGLCRQLANGKLRKRYAKMDDLKTRCIICQPTVMIDVERLREVDGWNESLTYVIDLELWFRLGQRSNFVHIPKATAVFRKHGRNLAIRCHEDIKAEGQSVRRHYENADLNKIFYFLDSQPN